MSSLERTVFPDGYRDHELDDLGNELCELAAHIDAAMCRWLELLSEYDERRGWGQEGCSSCVQWLAWRCCVSPRTAREYLRVAHRLRELPLVRDAFARGELSYSKVRALTRLQAAEDEPGLLRFARTATAAHLDRAVGGYKRVERLNAAAVDESCERGVRYRHDEEGRFRLDACLSAEEGALVLAALEAAGRDLPDRDDETPREPTAMRADALLHALTDPGDVQAIVIVDVDALTGTAGGSAEPPSPPRCETAAGRGISNETARRLCCDGHVTPVAIKNGTPLNVGRARRTVTPALRKALLARDRTCRFPGCHHTAHVHAHHIEHWVNGGATDLENLVLLCSHHHRLVHEGGFTVSADMEFFRPDGRRIPHVPDHPRGNLGTLKATRPEIGPKTLHPLWAGEQYHHDLCVSGLLGMAPINPRDEA